MSMAHKNIAAAIGLLAFTGWYAVLTASLPELEVMQKIPGPSFFPWLITAALAALSIALLVQGIKKLKSANGVSAGQSDLKTPVLALASFAIYLGVLPFLGFVPSSIALFGALMWLYGARNPLMIAACAIGGPLILFVLFRYGFNIILPRGLW